VLCSKKILGPENIFGQKDWVPKKFWIKKEFGQLKIRFKNFGSKTLLGQKNLKGGVKTVGTSSLDYRKPTYQILASYYA